jgi:hypothetical protein
MSNLTREQREELARREPWRFGSPEKLLFPVYDSEDLMRAPGRLSGYRGDKEEVKRRMIAAALRLGLPLPKPWHGEAAAMGASFSAGAEAAPADELPDPVDGAILYAEARNKGLPAAARYTPSGQEDARKQAEEFAERRNNHFRKQRSGRE